MSTSSALAQSPTYLVDTLGLPSWLRDWEKWIAVGLVDLLLWVIGGILLARVVRWAADRYAGRLLANFEDSDDIVQSENMKHRRALVDVVAWTLIALVGIIIFVHVLLSFGVPITSLIGPGAVVGAALGFGAQRVVQDVLAGFFIVAEHQYGYGDVVSLTVTGGSTAEGTVEDVTLRVTKLRDSDGELVTVPNGQVVKATNLSKDWARAVVDVPIPLDSDINVVNAALREVGQSFFESDRWNRLLLDAPQPLGVTSLELDSATVRMVARTLPGRQFEVGRALRAAIIQGLAERGVMVTAPPRSQSISETAAQAGGDAPGSGGDDER